MSETHNDIRQQIAKYQTLLDTEDDPELRQVYEKKIARLHAQRASMQEHTQPAIHGQVDLHNTSTAHVAVGTNLGTIIYGRPPEQDEQQRLDTYLHQLAAKLALLPLRGLAEAVESKSKDIHLSAVYTMLATRRRVEVVRGTPQELGAYFDADDTDELKEDYDPDYALPTTALFVQDGRGSERDELRDHDARTQPPPLRLERAVLATEAVHQHPRMVLLGVPGGGKSTFVRHLAWALAQRSLNRLDYTTTLAGWDDAQRVLPVFVPLRTLAGRLPGITSDTYHTTVSDVLRDALVACDYDATDAHTMLRQSLRRGATLVLFDGLDEVPLEATDTVANRHTTVQAVHAFAHFYEHARVVVTCRTRAFADDLRDMLAWPVDELAPFTLGQVRHFVPAWYRELAAGTSLTNTQAQSLSTYLIDALDADDTRSAKLCDMAGTPLLLTMMALVVYNKGELPRDRPDSTRRFCTCCWGNGTSCATRASIAWQVWPRR